MREFTIFEPLENTVNDISTPAQQARLDQVRVKDITQLLDRSRKGTSCPYPTYLKNTSVHHTGTYTSNQKATTPKGARIRPYHSTHATGNASGRF